MYRIRDKSAAAAAAAAAVAADIKFLKFVELYGLYRRSQWPRGLRRRSAAARLLVSWVQIPLGHGCLSVVSVVCCQVEVSVTS